MNAEHITPEEKLLKIIENPGTEKKSIYPLQKKSSKGFLSGSSKLKEKFAAKNLIKYASVNNLTKTIIILSLCFTLFLFIDFIKSSVSVKGRLESIKASEADKDKSTASKVSPKAELSEALVNAKNRNMFTFLPPKSQSVVEVEDLSRVLADIKLVGILWSDNPQAMVENNKEQKTYLLNKGDQFGKFKIKKIFQDKVILESGNQEWELR